MFESKNEKLIPVTQFYKRLFVFFAFSVGVLILALLIGISGYHFIAGFGWIDATLNASMILTGMGPVDKLPTDTAKLFASAYALFSGLVFITMIGVVLAPVMHRILHKFHIDDEDINA